MLPEKSVEMSEILPVTTGLSSIFGKKILLTVENIVMLHV
jgi:hypothetical protein